MQLQKGREKNYEKENGNGIIDIGGGGIHSWRMRRGEGDQRQGGGYKEAEVI